MRLCSIHCTVGTLHNRDWWKTNQSYKCRDMSSICIWNHNSNFIELIFKIYFGEFCEYFLWNEYSSKIIPFHKLLLWKRPYFHWVCKCNATTINIFLHQSLFFVHGIGMKMACSVLTPIKNRYLTSKKSPIFLITKNLTLILSVVTF